MSLGNLGTFTGRKGADKEQCRDTHTHTHTHTHSQREKEREEIPNCREKTQILWRRAMINLATQRVVFVAAKSNSLTLAIFSVVCGICCFCVCVCVCVLGGGGGGRNRQAGCLSGLVLLIPWGISIETRGAAVLDHFPGADVTPQVAFSTVGREHER